MANTVVEMVYTPSERENFSRGIDILLLAVRLGLGPKLGLSLNLGLGLDLGLNLGLGLLPELDLCLDEELGLVLGELGDEQLEEQLDKEQLAKLLKEQTEEQLGDEDILQKRNVFSSGIDGVIGTLLTRHMPSLC